MSIPSFANLKAIEFSHAILGPSCGLILADLGMDVLKIEPVEGDPTRTLKGFGVGYFPMFNRNKKSLALNLKSEAGQRIVMALAEQADVLIENYAPGTMDRLGLGYQALAQRNPRLIYCSLKGYLPGPYERRVALDEVVQMQSGIAYMTGPVGQPLRAGISVVDITAGAFSALSVLVALRERDRTGKGQLVRGGLFESAAYLVGQHMVYQPVLGEPIPPMPGKPRSWAIYQPFETGDGDLVFVGVTSDKHWHRFCEVFHRPDLLADASLATNNQRYLAHERLTADLAAMFRRMSTAEVLAGCEQAEIPFAPVARPEDLLEDPHLLAAGALWNVEVADGVCCNLPTLPLAFSSGRMELRLQPPRVGQHTVETLRALGYQDDQIAQLKREGVVAF
jgi:crotonobetainyl-CoA:carnitine CoA-transferase CaiB-like acyl-CoA transferase